MPKILIVEDEATVRDTLALNLRAEGYDVATASDGEAGLAAARSGKPDLVVLDVMLPKLDGLTVCRLLRRESALPIILLTARGTETDKIIGLETGADDYIVKPFALGEFLARVRAALRRGQAGDRVAEGACLPGSAAGPSGAARLPGDAGDLPGAARIRPAGRADAQPGRRLDARAARWPASGGTSIRARRGPSMSMSAGCARRSKRMRRSPVRIVTVRGMGYRFEG